jgi:hypothetical protein
MCKHCHLSQTVSCNDTETAAILQSEDHLTTLQEMLELFLVGLDMLRALSKQILAHFTLVLWICGTLKEE